MKLRTHIPCKDKLGNVVLVRRDCFVGYVRHKKINKNRKHKQKKKGKNTSNTSDIPKEDHYEGDIDEPFKEYPAHEAEVAGVQNALAGLLKLHSTLGQQLVMDVYDY